MKFFYNNNLLTIKQPACNILTLIIFCKYFFIKYKKFIKFF